MTEDWEREKERERDREREEIETVRAIAESARTEVKVVEKIVETFTKSLFGNGQPGVIDRLHKRIDDGEDKIWKKLSQHDRLLWLGIGAILMFQFLSGGGLISFKSLFGK